MAANPERTAQKWNAPDIKSAMARICTGRVGKTTETFDTSGYEEMERIHDFLLPDYTVLEFGGGIGRIAKHVAPLVKKMIVIDISSEMIRLGKDIWCKDISNIEWVQNLYNIPLNDNSIDFAYSLVVFYHLRMESRDAVYWLEEMCRVLKPGGYIIIGDIIQTDPVQGLEFVESKKKFPNISQDLGILTTFRKRETHEDTEV